MSEKSALIDETTMTEITIQPDGRVYVFGPSLGILELLETLAPHDQRLQRLLSRTIQMESTVPEDA